MSTLYHNPRGVIVCTVKKYLLLGGNIANVKFQYSIFQDDLLHSITILKLFRIYASFRSGLIDSSTKILGLIGWGSEWPKC